MWPLYAAAIFLILAVAAAKYLRAAAVTGSRLPPSPPSLPFIGHLHLLLAGGQLPHLALHALAVRHGPLLYLRLGRVPTLVVSSADVAADLFRSHDLAFATRPRNAVFDAITYGGRNISFAPYGDFFRRAKKLAVVHLLSSKRVASFAAVRSGEVAVLLRRVADNVGEAVEMRKLLYEYTNAVVSRLVAGDRGNAAKFRDMIDDSSRLLSAAPGTDLLPPLLAKAVNKLSGFDKKLEILARKSDEFLSAVLEQHEKKRREEGDEEEEDLVDVLLRLRRDGSAGLELGDDEVKAITKDLLAAATDTTSVTLEWTMAELLRNPAAMAKLQAEVRRVAGDKAAVAEEDIARMEYMKAVIKEVLRLRTPAPLLVPHESTAAVVLRGYQIPPGTRLLINAWSIGRDPVAWDTPEEFRPERFVGGGGGEQNEYRFIPFGAGRRMCPGVNFAMAVVEAALAGLMQRFDWRLPEGMTPAEVDVEAAAGLTTPPRTPLRLVPVPFHP